MLLSIGLVATFSAIGVFRAANRQVAGIARVAGLREVLSSANGNVENFLLVGSDSREGSDPNAPDYGGIGNTADVSGHRSDTIMILRRDRNGGPAALLSIPRDLWVDIAGTGKQSRINSAYQSGPATLVQTVQQSLKMPIHHYVEIDFQGFKALVDAIGGVQVCFLTPARDEHTGLNITAPGCYVLDGIQALAYARSRYYETFENGAWVRDGTSDLGRTKRQQAFVNTAVEAAVARIKANPLSTGQVLVASTRAVRIDDGLNVLDAAGALRVAVGAGLAQYSLPVVGKVIGGNAVLLLGDGAQAVLDYFAGVTTTPPPAG
jgi:LCP family protein required for cell wall assembly